MAAAASMQATANGEKWHGENNHQRASSRAFAAA
jgi:hypothetical protein